MTEENQEVTLPPRRGRSLFWTEFLNKMLRQDVVTPPPMLLRNLGMMFGLETISVVHLRTSTGTTVHFKRSVAATFHNILITAAISGIWLSTMNGLTIQRGDCEMFVKLAVILINLNMVTGLVSLITSRTSSWSLQEIMRMCLEIDQSLIENPTDHYTNSSKRFSIVFTPALICMISSASLTIWEFTQHHNYRTLALNFTFNLIQFIVLVTTTNCVFWISQVRQRLMLLNVKFRQLEIVPEESTIPNMLITAERITDSKFSIRFSNNMPACPADLQKIDRLMLPLHNKTESSIFQIRSLHNKVCKMVPLINDIFGVAISFFLMTVFSMIINIVYNAIFYISTPLFADLESGLVLGAVLTWTVLYSGQAVAIIWASKATSYEVRETSDIIRGLLVRPQLGQGVEQQLKLFQEQVLNEDLSLTAGGLMALEEPLPGVVAVSMLCYLLVLMQMFSDNSAELHNISTK